MWTPSNQSSKISLKLLNSNFNLQENKRYNNYWYALSCMPLRLTPAYATTFGSFVGCPVHLLYTQALIKTSFSTCQTESLKKSQLKGQKEIIKKRIGHYLSTIYRQRSSIRSPELFKIQNFNARRSSFLSIWWLCFRKNINSHLPSMYYQDELESILMDGVSHSISDYKSQSGI